MITALKHVLFFIGVSLLAFDVHFAVAESLEREVEFPIQSAGEWRAGWIVVARANSPGGREGDGAKLVRAEVIEKGEGLLVRGKITLDGPDYGPLVSAVVMFADGKLLGTPLVRLAMYDYGTGQAYLAASREKLELEQRDLRSGIRGAIRQKAQLPPNLAEIFNTIIELDGKIEAAQGAIGLKEKS